MSANTRIARLENLLSGVSIQGGGNGTVKATPQPRRRRRRPRGNTGSIGAAFKGRVVTAPQISGGASGSIRIRHKELWSDVSSKPNAGESVWTYCFHPGKKLSPFINSLSKLFDRFQVHACAVEWYPSVGTTTAGSVTLGVDWDLKSTVTERKQVVVLNPNLRLPVYQPGNLIIPSNLLMARKYLQVQESLDESDDNCPFRLCVGLSHDKTADAKSLGEVWVTYDLTLQGPRV
jgi:hypothetical protein